MGEFSETTTAVDVVSKHGNPFDTDSPLIRNLVTCSELDLQQSKFLLQVLELGEKAYAEFRKCRLQDKSKKLFDTIPKTRIKIDLGKETNFFTRHVEYARSRQYDVNHPLTYEIISMPLLNKGRSSTQV